MAVNGEGYQPSRKYQRYRNRGLGQSHTGNGKGNHFAIGGPKGNKFGESHGLISLRNAIRNRGKRGRSFIDLRSNSGQNAVAVQAGLINDLGGIEHISTAQKVLIELVGRELYYLDETDQRIVHVCRAVPKLKHSPKGMAMLYGYRSPIIANLSKHLMALGLEKKPPPAKSLDEILSEDDDVTEERNE